MAYAETKDRASGATGCTEWAISRGRKLPQRPHVRHPDRMKVQSTPLKKYRETEGVEDAKGYTVSGGKGKLSGTDDSGTAFTVNNDATITYQPGYWENRKAYSNQDGFYNKSGTKVISGPVTVYTGTYHTGYLSIGVSGGRVLLNGDNGAKMISFDAGSSPTVTPVEETKVFLTQKASAATQNFAFEGMEEFDMDYEGGGGE